MAQGAQLLLFGDKPPCEHGGKLALGHRKEERPFSSKKPIHLVLRSSHAKGSLSLLLHSQFIRSLLGRLTKKWAIAVYEFSTNGTHIHLLIRARYREDFQNFLRALSGTIALRVTDASKGKPFGKRFWDLLAWSRLSEWGKAFKYVKNYVLQNRLETLGVIPYTPRKRKSPQANQESRTTENLLRF